VGGLLTHDPLSLPRFFGWRLAICKGADGEGAKETREAWMKNAPPPNVEWLYTWSSDGASHHAVCWDVVLN